MAYVKVEALDACVDCVQIIANGEISAYADNGQAHAEKMREHYGPNVVHLVNGNGEASYRNTSCDICGNTHAGDYAEVCELATGITVKARHLSGDEVDAMCQARRGVEEITDACAVTIASYWQSSGWSGEHFASLASGAETDPEGLGNNIHYAYTKGVPTLPANEQVGAKLELDMLGTWLLDKMRDMP